MDFVGRAAIVAFFTFHLIGKARGIAEMLQRLFDGTGLANDRLAALASHSAAALFLLLMLVFTVVRWPASAGSTWANRLIAIGGTFLPMSIALVPAVDAPLAVKTLGFSLSTLGILLSSYCLVWLGRAFSVDAQARRLVTSGPYALVRHPLYVCEMIAVLGVAVANTSIAAFGIAAFELALQWRRAMNEERVLASRFPEYADYARRVPGWLPLIKWRSTASRRTPIPAAAAAVLMPPAASLPGVYVSGQPQISRPGAG